VLAPGPLRPESPLCVLSEHAHRLAWGLAGRRASVAELCIKDDTLYQYHDHPDLEEVAGRMFGELR
jgi:hypothetical protein